MPRGSVAYWIMPDGISVDQALLFWLSGASFLETHLSSNAKGSGHSNSA